MTPEVRPAPKESIQVVVPLTGTKLWLLALNDEPPHHLSVAMSSMASVVVLIVVPAPAFDEAVPVISPIQLVP